MKTMVCPKCRENAFFVKEKRCTNESCDLFHASNVLDIEKTPMTMRRLFWKVWYWRPRDGYYYIRNRFFRRYDLVRTGLPKHSWCDVDYKMLLGVMGLVESYVVDEEGIFFVNESDSGMPELVENAKRQNRNMKKILDLYLDWKVTYPYMCKKHHEMLMDDTKDLNSEAYFAYEEEIRKFEDKMMRRAVNLRGAMWT